MINLGKYSILGININAVDYEFAVSTITNAAKNQQACSVSALAVHGVMTGFLDSTHARRLNGLDLVVPDGQPVRWAIDWLYDKQLPDRVYGPNLTLKVAEALAEENLSIYLYGSQKKTLEKFARNLKLLYPRLVVAGMEESKFRRLSVPERSQLVRRIEKSGANVVFLGLGCPRQETWAYEYRNLLNIPILAVGAAFDFHAGTLAQAPRWMQNAGLEWLFRFFQEPKRLWQRYLILNPLYIWQVIQQYLGLKKFAPTMPDGKEKIESYG